MKQITFLLLLLAVVSCNQSSKTKSNKITKTENKKYATELLGNEFLKYADSSNIDKLSAEIKTSFNIYDEENYKIVHIDAEELSEFSFDFFLTNLNKILAKRNLNLNVKKSNPKDNDFEILINNRMLQLYSQKDIENNIFWETAPRNFFKKVNEILKLEKSAEQFYLLYSGNDLHTMLLTEKQFLIISDYYRDNENEKPYIP